MPSLGKHSQYRDHVLGFLSTHPHNVMSSIAKHIIEFVSFKLISLIMNIM